MKVVNTFSFLPLWLLDNTPKPTIEKHQWFEPFFTNERVQINCNMSGVGWEYHWNKDSKLQTTNPELTIDSVSVTDTGDYHCKAQRGDFSVDSETLQVRVQGESIIYFFIIIYFNVNIIPILISLSLQCLSKIPTNCMNMLVLGSVLSTLSDLIQTTFPSLLLEPPIPQVQSDWTEAFPGENISLLCLIQNVSENWNYMWFNNSGKMNSGGETNITVNTLTLSVQSSHDGLYVCQAELQDRNVTTANSTPHSLTVKGKNLLLLYLKAACNSQIIISYSTLWNTDIKKKKKSENSSLNFAY